MTEPSKRNPESAFATLERAMQQAQHRSKLFDSWRSAARSKVGHTRLAYDRFSETDTDLAIFEQALGEAFVAGMKATSHA